MPPEFGSELAKEIASKRFNGKFVRNGGCIWVEEGGNRPHRDVARLAGFNVVDDAGLALVVSKNEIWMRGNSWDFNTASSGPERDKTIEMAQKIAGASIKIIGR